MTLLGLSNDCTNASCLGIMRPRRTGGGGGTDGLIRKSLRKIQPGVRGRAGKGGMLRGQGGAHSIYDTEMAGGDSTTGSVGGDRRGGFPAAAVYRQAANYLCTSRAAMLQPSRDLFWLLPARPMARRTRRCALVRTNEGFQATERSFFRIQTSSEKKTSPGYQALH